MMQITRRWLAQPQLHYTIGEEVCVFTTAVPITKLLACRGYTGTELTYRQHTHTTHTPRRPHRLHVVGWEGKMS